MHVVIDVVAAHQSMLGKVVTGIEKRDQLDLHVAKFALLNGAFTIHASSFVRVD